MKDTDIEIPHLEDWFDRDKDTFVFITTEDRMGWEKLLDDGAAFCEYLLDGEVLRHDKDMIFKGMEICRNIINSMDTKKRVKILFQKDKNYTDGDTIVVATQVFKDKELSYTERIDVFVGQGVHEAAHIVYTDFFVFKALLSVIDEGSRNVVKNIFNILEDERIEFNVGADYPGHAGYLIKTKQWHFEHLYLKTLKKRITEEGDDWKKKMNHAERIMDVFFKIIRYPKFIDTEDLFEWELTLHKIKTVITPYPQDTKETMDAAVEVYKILEEFFEKTKPEEETKSFAESLKDSAVSEALSKMSTAGAGDALSPDIKSLMDSETPLESGGKTLKDIMGIEGEYIAGDRRDVFFYKAGEHPSYYKEAYARVGKFAAALSRVLSFESRDYKLVTKGCRSGYLNTNKLVEAVQGVSTVYERYADVKSNKIAVCLLIDESGSMGDGSGSTTEKARDCAVLFREALQKNKDVELFIYGHSGDMRYSGATEVWIYNEPGHTKKATLGSTRGRAQNRDGEAILSTAMRVRKFTKRPCVMFVISDGEPAANSYSGRRAVEDTAQKVRQAEQKYNFTIVQVAIDSSVRPELMFRHYVKLLDMATLTRDLGFVMKKVVKSMIKSSVRM